MKTDAVFLDLYKTLKKQLKEEVWREVEPKLFYIYLEPPDECVPDAVWRQAVKPVTVPITYPNEDVNRAVAVVASLLEQYGCISRQDLTNVLRGAFPRYGEEDLEQLAELAAKILTHEGKAVGRDAQLCIATRSAVEAAVEEDNYMVVRFLCRNGRTVTYVISPLEGAEEEEVEEVEEEL